MLIRGIDARAGEQRKEGKTERGGASRGANRPFVVLLGVALSWLAGVDVAAADKSGVAPNTISLPSGPGSIEGLGEAFQPTLNTGTAKYGIGLRLPPGTAGHAPALSLRYEGGSGNGPLGFGWTLSLPHIQRQCDKGIPLYVDGDNQLDDDLDGEVDEYDERDVFLNEMKEELVPQASGYFFSENEGAFIRYRRIGGHWEGTLPNGTRMEFGLTPAARVQDGPTGRVFRWLLERSTDTHGNTIAYSYRSFPDASDRNQKYLAAVRYGPGIPVWQSFHFVTFAYEDRPDWFEDCRPGFILRTGKRLKEIVVGTQGPTLPGHLLGDFDDDGRPDHLVRKYQLTYLRYAGINSHWSLLAKVLQVGADGVSSLPPATFGYAVCDPPNLLSATGREIGGLHEPPFVMDNDLVDLTDLNGDGLPDILKTESGGGPHTGYLNLGETTAEGERSIQWSAPREITSADELAWNVNLASANDVAHLADMDGDGVTDLAYKSAAGSVYYFANTKLSWGRRQAMSVQDSAPPAPFGNEDVRTADLDFDKRIDIIQSIPVGDGADYRIWFNLGEQRYSRSVTVPQESGSSLSQAGVQFTDFNGDRVPDLVRLRPGSLVVKAGLGHGEFAESVLVAIPDPGLDDTQIATARLQDVTGDGLADLVLERAEPGQLWCWLNLGNYAFGPRKIISGMPVAIGAQPAIRWADLNGNGTIDLVYADSESSPRLRTIDLGELLGCVPGHNVLTNIANGIGRVTSIEYQPSTRFALEDAAAGQPWPDAMPFPVSVVSAVITFDSLGHHYVTRYRYHDGYYDGVEKEFRGFARVEQIDLGDATAPTLVTRSQFDTGREHEALQGALLRQSTGQEDGKIFWEETTRWTTPPKTLMTGVNGQAVRYAHEIASVRRVLERGEGEERLLETECDYDDFGNKTRDANYGIVVNGDRSAFDDERVITTEYALNTNAWLIRFPARSEIQDEKGHRISRTETFYDDETFSGANFGQISTGNATLTRDWIDPNSAGAFVSSSRVHFDPYGNAVRYFDPLADGIVAAGRGHWREVEFDPVFHAFPEREIIHLGGGKSALAVEAGYDQGFGTIIRSVDLNGRTTIYGYDALARIARIVRPGDSEAYPTTEYDYGLAVPVGSNRVVNYLETRTLDKSPGLAGAKRNHYLVRRQFTDGLSRGVMSKSEAEPEAATGHPRVVVTGAVVFNARAASATVLNAFYSSGTADSLEGLLNFEDVSQPGWQGSFDDRGEMKSLDLAAAHQTRLIYDALLRASETINQDGTRTRIVRQPLVEYSFDENDTDSVSPHFGTPRAFHQDGLGRHIRTDEFVRLNDDGTPSTQVGMWTTRFDYDLNDKLTRFTDSQGNAKTMDYDGLQRTTSINDPNRGTLRCRYDAASNLLETRDAKGQRITYTYDGVNRLLTEDYHDEGQRYSFGHQYDPALALSPTNRPDVAYFYDEPATNVALGDGSVGTAVNTKGQLAYAWDLSGEEHLSFDTRGRISWMVKRTMDPVRTAQAHRPVPPSALVSYRTIYEHDSMDRLIRLIYPDNDEVNQDYNDRGQWMAVGGSAAGPIATISEYLPSGQIDRVRYGNDVQTGYKYDKRGRLQSLVTRAPGGNREYLSQRYEFDPASNVLGIFDERPSLALPVGGSRRNTQLFTYDSMNRLTRVQYSFNLPGEPTRNDGEINYRYDRIGNMLAQTSTMDPRENGLPLANVGQMDSGGVAGRWNRTGRAANDPPGPHALSRIQSPGTETQSYDYDANGNMLSIDGLACTWDFKDRLVAVENDEMRAEYVYDHTDRRIVKRVERKPSATNRASAITTLYINKYFEVREHDQPVKYVWREDVRLARVTGSLSVAERVQRLRVDRGWNLVSLAVQVTNAAAQLGGSQNVATVEFIYRWNQTTGDYQMVQPGEDLQAGTVLWLKVSNSATLALRGTYASPSNALVAVGGSYYPGAGLEALPISGALTNGTAAWFFAPNGDEWLAQLDEGPRLPSRLPELLAPGEAIFIHASAPDLLRMPDPNLRIRFYHQDHIGSSSVITDLAGNLIEETSFYPFGEGRTSYHPVVVPEAYRFTQKETDAETGIQYFEARFLTGRLGRFLRCDPIGAGATPGRLIDPQRCHPYVYAANNPLSRIDPLGLDDEEPGLLESGWNNLTSIAQGAYNEAAGQAKSAIDLVSENPGTTAAVGVGSVAFFPVTIPVGGAVILGGVGLGAVSATTDLLEAGFGDSFTSEGNQSLSKSERYEKVGSGLFKAGQVVLSILGVRSMQAPKPLTTVKPATQVTSSVNGSVQATKAPTQALRPLEQLSQHGRYIFKTEIQKGKSAQEAWKIAMQFERDVKAMPSAPSGPGPNAAGNTRAATGYRTTHKVSR